MLQFYLMEIEVIGDSCCLDGATIVALCHHHRGEVNTLPSDMRSPNQI